MQTFITGLGSPKQICKETAEVLDSSRLGKQRIEAKQILNCLETGVGWKHHPATKMWAGHHDALIEYSISICVEWIDRGYQDTTLPWFLERAGGARVLDDIDWPWWFGHPAMVASHRSKLLGKMCHFYTSKWHGHPFEKPDVMYFRHYPLPYIWPDVSQEGVFFLSRAEAARQDWVMPSSWRYDSGTRMVTFV